MIVIDWDVFCNINSAKTKRTNIRANENASEWQLARKIHHFACRLVVTRQIQCEKILQHSFEAIARVNSNIETNVSMK